MKEREYYRHVGEWLVDEKGCQQNEFFHGYTVDPAISHEDLENTKKPDIVGIRYDRSSNKTPSFKFHFHLVEVKAGTKPQQIQNVIGEIESLKYYADDGNLAADTVSYWVALPTLDVPKNLRKWAEENNVGILVLESNDDAVVVREVLSPEPENMGFLRNESLSNKSQQSPGNFKKGVENTNVLKQIMEPDRFYDNLIRPIKERNQKERNYDAVFRYVQDTDARDALETLVSFLEEQDELAVRPHSGSPSKPPLFIDSNGKEVLRIIPLRRKFKILDEDGSLLFRISSEKKFDVTEDDVKNLTELKSYIQSRIA